MLTPASQAKKVFQTFEAKLAVHDQLPAEIETIIGSVTLLTYGAIMKDKIRVLLMGLLIVGPVVTGQAQRTSGDLDGTSWQLVKFQGGDGSTLVPDERSKYTITFGTNGYATVRVDCNRGGGSWKYKGPNQIQFGAMSVSRAKCGPGSLHDRIVREGGFVRNYQIKDGRLFLLLMEDGGTYELEPLKRSPIRKRS